jgi:predicted DsbA family dithiol-disulfide isomerase
VRLEQLQQEVRDVLEVVWHAFLLRPAPTQRSIEAFTQYTTGWARPAASEPAATFHTWAGDNAPPSHSMPSAIAGKAVLHAFGRDAFDRFHLALMHAYFADNLTVSDRAVMLDVARAGGLDADVLDAKLDGDQPALEGEVIADHREALHRGIAAVPTVVVNDEYVLQGAMTVAQYQKVVARLGG